MFPRNVRAAPSFTATLLGKAGLHRRSNKETELVPLLYPPDPESTEKE